MLQKKIDGMLYERTAMSKKPKKLIEKDFFALREEDRLTPDLVFRDPYFLDFLGLKDTFSEKDLEMDPVGNSHTLYMESFEKVESLELS